MGITNKQIWDELRALSIVIRGEPDNREDLGLLGDVLENSQFRRGFVKLLWLLIPLLIITWGTMAIQLFTN